MLAEIGLTSFILLCFLSCGKKHMEKNKQNKTKKQKQKTKTNKHYFSNMHTTAFLFKAYLPVYRLLWELDYQVGLEEHQASLMNT